MEYAEKRSENSDDKVQYWHRVMRVKWVSSTWEANTVNAATKEKCEEEGAQGDGQIRNAVGKSVNSSQKQAAITN